MQAIQKKIVGFSVVTEEDKNREQEALLAAQKAQEILSKRSELRERPSILRGVTYKIKAPVIENALYITINDAEVLDYNGEPVLSEDGQVKFQPFEIFINSKDMKDFQWIVALTRVMSAVFRKGGDVTFLIEELESVVNPSGGYFKKGGKYMPSLVAEIGEVLKNHLIYVGAIKQPGLDEHQKQMIAEKLEVNKVQSVSQESNEAGDFPANATLCTKCNYKAVIMVGGCPTCASCGDSKCS